MSRTRVHRGPPLNGSTSRAHDGASGRREAPSHLRAAEVAVRAAVARWFLDNDPAWILEVHGLRGLLPGTLGRLFGLLGPFLEGVTVPSATEAADRLRLDGHDDEVARLEEIMEEAVEPSPTTYAEALDALRLWRGASMLGQLAADLDAGEYRRTADFLETLERVKSEISSMARSDTAPAAFRPLSLVELSALPEPTWLVRDLLPSGGFCCLFGPEGSGKSFVAIDIALRVAAGFGWYGRPCKRGVVLYAAGEGVSSIYRRVQAWQSQFLDGGQPPDLGGFFVVRDVPRLLTDGVDGLRRGIDLLPERPSLIVVDTLARALVGGDENAAKDVGVAVDRLASLCRDLGSTVLVIHHSRKDKGAIRGSSALPGAADTVIEALMTDDVVTLKLAKQKDARPIPTVGLKLVAVPLGLDADGAAVSSCYVTPRSGGDLAAETAGHAKSILEVLSGPSVGDAGATRGAILQVFPEMPRKSFHDAVNRLMRDGHVERIRGTSKYRRCGGV